MHNIIETGKKLSRQKFVRYVLVGGTTFAIDFSILITFHDVFGMDAILAATISYWSSIGFNFWVNRMWTFGAAESDITKHLTFYLTLLAVNYGFTILCIAGGKSMGVPVALAKIFATGLQTVWTYILYKKVVFK